MSNRIRSYYWDCRRKLMNVFDNIGIGEHARVVRRSVVRFATALQCIADKWSPLLISDDARIKLGHGQYFLRSGREDKAILAYGRLKDAGKISEAQLISLGKLHLAKSDYSTALSCFDTLAIRKNAPDYLLAERFCCYVASGREAAVIEWLEQISKNSPKSCASALLQFVQLRSHYSDQILVQQLAEYPSTITTILSETAETLYPHGLINHCIALWKLDLKLQIERMRRKSVSSKAAPFFLKSDPWTIAIGHFAIIDSLIKAIRLNEISAPKLVLGNENEHTANECLLGYISQVPEISKLEPPNARSYKDFGVPDYCLPLPLTVIPRADGELEFLVSLLARTQQRWENEGHAPLFRITEDHLDRGRSVLRMVGIRSNSWFVTLHVRESDFHRGSLSVRDGRNADIATYLPAIQAIIDAGGYVIRIGDPSMQRLRPQIGLFDYAHSKFKSDWMDIFLLGNARFHLGTNSGVSVIPNVFGVPCAYTNMLPYGFMPWYGGNIGIPKIIVESGSGSTVPIHTLLAEPFSFGESPHLYDAFEFKICDNDANDILDLTREALDSYSATRAPQMRENRVFFPMLDQWNKVVPGPIAFGEKFIQKYPELIDRLC